MSGTETDYDVMVIGAGHAGCEAALAAARLGARTLLLTTNLDHIAQMSCNPAIGGIAKGQLVREIDALGGEMGLNTDAATIQFRMLNESKGAAVHSPRAQCDKIIYQKRMKHVLERQPQLFPHQAAAVRILTSENRVEAVETEFGDRFRAKAVIIATGTFLNGKLHYGSRAVPGGRAGDPASAALADSLREDLRLEIGRLKTGTPVRVLAGSMDLSSLTRQDPDPEPRGFSFRRGTDNFPHLGPRALPQLPCYLTVTTEKTAEVIRANLDRSPMYGGVIQGVGARYCPSIEDKIVRFPHHETHHIHLEPEGAYTDEYYLNGISTSMPVDVQWQLVRSLPGLENASITRYAYAIEYDFVFPHQLTASLALREWDNLFLAGQINGTSGYEEAAAQGLLAGINAARLAAGGIAGPLVLGRDEAYAGVMINDLITKEIVEPYRLFTSRAEHRLLLRQDNADLRLAAHGFAAGLVSAAEFARVEKLQNEISQALEILQQERGSSGSLWQRLRTPQTKYKDLPEAPILSARAAEQLEIEAKYEGYMRRESARAADLKNLQAWKIPGAFDYSRISGLRNEARAKLEKFRPADLAQAARLDGVTPAELALLQVHLKRGQTASRNQPVI